MKIYYLNDETKPVKVRLIAKDGENTYVTLQPQEYKVFEIEAPENSIPYLKRWDNHMILLSYICLEQIESK